MKIVQLVNTLDYADGGPARNAYDLNLALNSREGVTADLVWMSGSSAQSVASQEFVAGGVRHDRLIGSALGDAQSRLGVARLLRELTASDAIIVHGYYLWWVPLAVAWCRLRRRPVLLMPHGALTTYQQQFSTRKKKAFERLAGWHLRRSIFAFVTGSERERREVEKKFPRSRVVVAGVGTRMPEAPAGWEPQRYRRVVSISRLAPKKRVDISIRAIRVLKDRGIERSLTIAGHGDPNYVRQLVSLVSELEIEKLVTFVGLVRGDTKKRLLFEADALLLPSEDENFGIAVAEAAAHGVPVVTTNLVDAAAGLPSEICRTLETSSPDAIADAIIELERRDRSMLFERARSAAGTLFGWGTVADQWLEYVKLSSAASAAEVR